MFPGPKELVQSYTHPGTARRQSPGREKVEACQSSECFLALKSWFRATLTQEQHAARVQVEACQSSEYILALKSWFRATLTQEQHAARVQVEAC
jgi:hypothetical protein